MSAFRPEPDLTTQSAERPLSGNSGHPRWHRGSAPAERLLRPVQPGLLWSGNLVAHVSDLRPSAVWWSVGVADLQLLASGL